MKKTWIKLRRGLLTPEHVAKMGNRLWLYVYVLDQTDWATGMIYHWTDHDASVALGIPERTVKDQRQGLAADGYIACEQGYHRLSIRVDKWANPNTRENGDTGASSSFADGDTHEDTHGDTSHSQLPSTHKSHTTQDMPTHKMMDHIDEYPPELQGVVQDICEVWGHKPPSKKSQFFTMWIKGARELLEACGEFPVREVLSGIRERWEADGGGISITSPMSLVSLARDDAARRRSGPLNVKERGQRQVFGQGMTDKQKLAGILDGTWRGNE